jgi:hypothetical protein
MNRLPAHFLIGCDVEYWERNFNGELFLQFKDVEDEEVARTGRNMTQHRYELNFVCALY